MSLERECWRVSPRLCRFSCFWLICRGMMYAQQGFMHALMNLPQSQQPHGQSAPRSRPAHSSPSAAAAARAYWPAACWTTCICSSHSIVCMVQPMPGVDSKNVQMQRNQIETSITKWQSWMPTNDVREWLRNLQGVWSCEIPGCCTLALRRRSLRFLDRQWYGCVILNVICLICVLVGTWAPCQRCTSTQSLLMRRLTSHLKCGVCCLCYPVSIYRCQNHTAIVWCGPTVRCGAVSMCYAGASSPTCYQTSKDSLFWGLEYRRFDQRSLHIIAEDIVHTETYTFI